MKSSEISRQRIVFSALLERGLARAADGATTSAPYIRGIGNVDRLLNEFVIASLPAFLIGIWSGGAALAASLDAGTIEHWLAPLAAMLDTSGAATGLWLGLSAFLPLLVVAAAVSMAWEVLFATLRQRPPDAGWPMFAWLFVLLLPLSTPLYLVALGASFGAVVGKHIFGGTGRYIVSPALLGVLFVQVAYPAALGGLPSTFAAIVAGDTIATTGGWVAVFLGRETGAIGSPSALACLLGGLYLWMRGAISPRTLGGAILGLVVTAWAFSLGAGAAASMPLAWHWHLALGYFAFCAVFVSTDPSIAPLMPAARWIYGALFGALTVVIRTANPAHPEGTLVALLLASLCIPLVDHGLLRLALRRGIGGLRGHG